MVILNAGEAAPEFAAPDQNGNHVVLNDFAGRKLFMFFYPKANTSG